VFTRARGMDDGNALFLQPFKKYPAKVFRTAMPTAIQAAFLL
jgi:hypothetical protein